MSTFLFYGGPGKAISTASVFVPTVNANHVLQDQDPLGQDLQGLPELLHGFPLHTTNRRNSGCLSNIQEKNQIEDVYYLV